MIKVKIECFQPPDSAKIFEFEDMNENLLTKSQFEHKKNLGGLKLRFNEKYLQLLMEENTVKT